MFTGIVEETGTVRVIRERRDSIRLAIRAELCAQATHPGDSMAVNGCCLTIARLAPGPRTGQLEFDLLRETWNRTNLRTLRPGASVNLERALRADSRLGGHFVTGHIDATGRIRRWEQSGKDYLLEIEAPPEVMRYVIHKGSIAIDGISLTVADVAKKRFQVWIIPHTLQITALRERQVGDLVNLEADLLGKYVERFVSATKPRG